MALQPTETDVNAVTEQLGRPPRGEWSVARRCSCGLPQVIETPTQLEDGTPFPTMWWLSCRSLCSAIGTLEANGFMNEVNESLASNEEMRSRLKISTGDYVSRRDSSGDANMLSKEHPGGGPLHVKCLHAHAAHHLVSSDNPVGEAVLAKLIWIDPVEPCVEMPK